MRALITGGHGFVGRHLLAHLEEAGDEVSVIDRHGDEPVDILEPGQVDDALAAHAPEVVYHLAGWADVAASWQEPVAALRTNAEGTLNVLRASHAAGVDRVLCIASADVYGIVSPEDLPLDESTPVRPTSPYAASKLAAEAVALQAHLGLGMHVVCARPFNHLGPGQSEQFVAPGLAARIARAERDGVDVIRVGSLEARRDFTDVRDIVRAYRLLVRQGRAGEVYNVCSGEDHAISEVADQLLAQARRPLRLETDPELLRPVDLPVLRGDATKLHDDTGWKPEIGLAQTLTDVLDDMRDRIAGEG